MFGKSKDAPVGHDQTAAAPPPPIKAAPARVAPVERAMATMDTGDVISCISSGMTLVGKLVGDGVLKIYGNVEGELRGSGVTVYEGAQVVGDITAQEVTIAGHVKGTIRGIRVTLQGTAVVDGEISHRSLMIDESAQFEGTSRRGESLTDKAPSAVQPVRQAQPAQPPQADQPAQVAQTAQLPPAAQLPQPVQPAQAAPQPQASLPQGNGHVRAEHDDTTIQAAQ